MTKETTKNVYQCIAAVQGELAKLGIGKDRTAQTGGQGSYKFRGIDDIYNALAPLLSGEGLCILPRVLDRQITERLSGQGKALFYVVVYMEFDFVSSHDGSTHTVRTLGEAMDSGDKATNKAMSAAYKYACLQTFCIPTEGESKDSEQDTHTDIAPKKVKSVFSNASLRNTFTKNVIYSFNEVDETSEDAQETLDTLQKLNSDKLAELKGGDEHDGLALDEIRKAYALKKQQIFNYSQQSAQLGER